MLTKNGVLSIWVIVPPPATLAYCNPETPDATVRCFNIVCFPKFIWSIIMVLYRHHVAMPYKKRHVLDQVMFARLCYDVKGFFNAGSGHMTNEFKAALEEHGLQAFQGERAAVQPGKLSDCLLHETAVSWIRVKLSRTLPAKPWEESPLQLLARLKRVAATINKDHNVAGLCRELPSRVRMLHERGGGKLGK